MSSKTTKNIILKISLFYITYNNTFINLPLKMGCGKKTSKKVLEVSIVAYYMCVLYTYIDGISSMH